MTRHAPAMSQATCHYFLTLIDEHREVCVQNGGTQDDIGICGHYTEEIIDIIAEDLREEIIDIIAENIRDEISACLTDLHVLLSHTRQITEAYITHELPF